MFRSHSKKEPSKPRRSWKFESLERRELMAADLSILEPVNGVLRITGTDEIDQIALRFTNVEQTQIGVFRDGDAANPVKTFDANRISAIEVLGLGGDDTIDLRTMVVDCRILGGPGENKLYGGEGNDVIVGGKARDEVFGGGGVDWIYGRGAYQSDQVVDGQLIEAAFDEIDGGEGGDYISRDAGVASGSSDSHDHDLEDLAQFDYDDRAYLDLMFRYRDSFGFVITEKSSGEYEGDGDAVHATGLAAAAAALRGNNAAVQELLTTLRDQPFVYENGATRLIRHPLVNDYAKSGDDFTFVRHAPVTKDGIVGVMAGLHYAYNADGMNSETRTLARDVMGKYVDYLIGNQWKTVDHYPDEYWETKDDPSEDGEDKIFANIYSAPDEESVVMAKGVESYCLSPSDLYALQNVAAKMGFATAGWNVFGSTLATITQVLGDKLQDVLQESASDLADFAGDRFRHFLESATTVHKDYSFHIIPGFDRSLVKGSIDFELSQADQDNIVDAVENLVRDALANVLPALVDGATEAPAQAFESLNLMTRAADKIVDALPNWLAKDQARTLVTHSLQQAMPWLTGEAFNEMAMFAVAHRMSKEKVDVAHLSFWPTVLEFETRPEMVDFLAWSVKSLDRKLDDNMALFSWLNRNDGSTNKWLKHFEDDPSYGNVAYAWKVPSSDIDDWVADGEKAKSKDFGEHRLDYLLLRGLDGRGRPEGYAENPMKWLDDWRDLVDEAARGLTAQAEQAWLELKDNVVLLAKKLVTEFQASLTEVANVLRNQADASFTDVAEGLRSVTKDLGAIAKTLSRDLDASWTQVTTAVASLTSNVNDLAKALRSAGADFDEIVSQLWKRAGSNLATMAHTLKAAGASYGNIADALWAKAGQNLSKVAKTLVAVGAEYGEVVDALWSKSGRNLNKMAQTLDAAGADFGDIARDLWDVAGKNLNKLGAALEAAGADYDDIVNELWKKSGKSLDKMAKCLRAAGASYGEIVEELWSKSGKNLNAMAESLDAAGASFAETAKALADKAGSKAALEKAIKHIGGSAKEVSSAVSKAWSSVSGGASGAVNKVKKALGW